MTTAYAANMIKTDHVIQKRATLTRFIVIHTVLYKHIVAKSPAQFLFKFLADNFERLQIF
jgi:hypothetical protein